MRTVKYLITGGTGSLGRALIRRLLDPKGSYTHNDIVVYSRDEGKHAKYFSDLNVKCVIGDVRDLEKLKDVIEQERPSVVIHAAALKRTDDMEANPDECYKTNVIGSENVCKAAIRAKHLVRNCVLVSTDKACKPVNVYGASKFTAERIFTHYGRKRNNPTRFISVRYGNVIASRGSFIPLWRERLQSGQDIRVTDEECARFLFTLDDAVNFVLYSIQLSEYTGGRGEIFIPFLKPYKILDVLSVLGELEKVTPTVEIIGIRPGEKLHEDMLGDTEIPKSWVVKKNFPEDSSKVVCIMPPKSNLYGCTSYMIEADKYSEEPMNTSLNISKDREELKELIKRGLSEAN